MSEMEEMYEEIQQQVKQQQALAETAEEEKALASINEAIAECEKIQEALSSLKGLEFELRGTWLIVKGDTMPYSKLLGRNVDENGVQQGLGLQWKRHKKYWVYPAMTKLPEPYQWNMKTQKIEKKVKK